MNKKFAIILALALSALACHGGIAVVSDQTPPIDDTTEDRGSEVTGLDVSSEERINLVDLEAKADIRAAVPTGVFYSAFQNGGSWWVYRFDVSSKWGILFPLTAKADRQAQIKAYPDGFALLTTRELLVGVYRFNSLKLLGPQGVTRRLPPGTWLIQSTPRGDSLVRDGRQIARFWTAEELFHLDLPDR